MDETLVKISPHITKLPKFDGTFMFKGYQGQEQRMYIMFRPDMRKMLRKLSQEFELILFTSSIPEYANAAIDFIEGGQQIFQYRLTKPDCLPIPQFGFHVKDLRILLDANGQRNLKDIILIDNMISNFLPQIANGLPVSDFNGNPKDRELRKLSRYLLQFRDTEAVPDVREKLRKDFEFMHKIYNQTKECREFVMAS